jgi:hypothetical protein
MKKIIIALMGAAMLFTSGLANSIQSNGWRLNITSSMDEDTHVVVSEVEFLNDNVVGEIAVPVDVTQVDLGGTTAGGTECGWNCDSISTNQIGVGSVEFVANTKRNRQVGVAIDNNQSSYYTTDYKITPAPGNFFVKYSIYRGVTDPVRDSYRSYNVTGYSLTVPEDAITTGAPGSWTVEYLDSSTNSWEIADTRERDTTDINWNNAGRVYKVTDGGITFYLVDSSGTRSMVLGTDSDWSAPLSGTALTAANAAITSEDLVGRRLEFDL